jgi:hypothetical protein
MEDTSMLLVPEIVVLLVFERCSVEGNRQVHSIP